MPPTSRAGSCPCRGQRQGEARAPQKRRGKDRPKAAGKVRLEAKPWARREFGIDRPVGQGFGRRISGPGNGDGEQCLAAAEQRARASEAASQKAADAPAEA